MARNKKTALPVGCLIIALPVGLVASLWEKNRALGVGVAAGLFALLLLIAYLFRPRRCDICGNVLQRASYRWTIDGGKKRVCPHCNQSLAKRQSQQAMRRFK